MAPLTIYRASAGAGKTFRLVVEYIKLLMLRPDEYKHILAVTFTKKATHEMKIRILSQLYGLREGLSSSKGYMECVTKEMNLPENEVRKNAGIALNLILNDYNRFRIETIDSFFQRVLRNMTRELDISANMRVELNGEQIKDKAVDALIDSLSPTDHIFKRVLRFAEDNMDEGKTWNVVNDLKKFGNNIFSDFYQSHSKEYKRRIELDKNLFKNYRDNLYAIKKVAVSEIQTAAESLRLTITEQGFDISIFKNSNRSGLGKLYEYIGNGEYLKIPATVLKYAEDASAWLKKADEKLYGTEVITNVLMPALQQFLMLQGKNASAMQSCDVILRNLNNIELLGAIEDAVNESNNNANRFLLSSTNQLLSEMIGNADSPFIFEKIGTQIRHLMIDEFQDTSTLQWKNFKNLLLESMSYYDSANARGTVGSMIVGDVKQSIYRWRNGDWQLLNNIKSEFDNDSDTQIETLDTNYRSAANIINFNNAFFLQLKDICNIETAYDDVAQKVKKECSASGEIEFNMMSAALYKDRHKAICDKVAMLISQGVKAKDIAILGRGSQILKELSKTFMDFYPEIRVISQESFQFNASSAVNTIICALRLLQSPEDKILLATLEKYSMFDSEKCKELLNGIVKTKSLLDVVEDIFAAFDIARREEDSAFVSAFFDYLRDFTSKNTSTIRNFLRYWDEQICNKTIETEATDGVQMMTIHKSKGLEFDNVIIADGNWETKVTKGKIWVELNDKPFSDIPFTIIQPSAALDNTIFKEAYQEECLQNTVDNMNLLYVAFTRAGKNLYFYGQTSKKYDEIEANSMPEKYASQNISGLVEQCLDNLQTDIPMDYFWDGDEEDDDNLNYTKRFGTFATKEEKTKEVSKNVFEMPVTPQNISLKFAKPQAVFVQSNRSKDFVSHTTETNKPKDLETPQGEPSEQSISYISIGLLLHNVLSQISNVSDVENVLQKLEVEEVIADKSHAKLIKKRITDSKFANAWFAPSWTVYNECSILTPEGVKRPDRVITNGKETIVIDFKFGKPKPEYKAQVSNYKTLLEQIGLPNVKGYLWYVYEDKAEEV